MASGSSFPHGYNWHFDDLQQPLQDARALWPCFDSTRLQEGFASGPRADAPRLLQLLREALQGCGNVFVAPVDELAHTILLGGEIGMPTPTGTEGIALHANYTAGNLPTVDTLAPGAAGGRLVLVRGTPPTWWARPWQGELFPDDEATAWIIAGNLALNGSAGGLRWTPWQNAPLPSLPYGTTFTGPVGATTGAAGGIAFVNQGTVTSTFLMPVQAETSMVAEVPVDGINAATNLMAPRTWVGDRTVVLTAAPATPPAFAFTDAYPRSTVTELEPLWRLGAGQAGCSLAWTRVGTAFLVPWSAPAEPIAARDVMVQAMLLGLRALHAAGHPSVAGRIPQLPQLEILEPRSGARNSSDTITLRWQTLWQRFDGKSYTETYPVGFTQCESTLTYRVLWSGDRGTTWTSALTDEPTQPGVWPERPVDRLSDAGTGNESFTFALPEGLPIGEYLLLVEAWRLSTQEHCSTHQVRVLLRSDK
jgi:hypothetical protein